MVSSTAKEDSYYRHLVCTKGTAGIECISYLPLFGVDMNQVPIYNVSRENNVASLGIQGWFLIDRTKFCIYF